MWRKSCISLSCTIGTGFKVPPNPTCSSGSLKSSGLGVLLQMLIIVTGWQYFHIGRMLLAIYDPRNSNVHVGLELQRAQRRLQVPPHSSWPATNCKKTILTHARELYGVAFASSAFAPARVTSCNSLPLFGPWFTDYNEQVILIGLLKEVETYIPR